MEINDKYLAEINLHISDALEQWADIMLEADVKAYSFFLNYSDRDLLNAMHIFFHVAQNKAIKNDYYETPEMAGEKMHNLRLAIKDCFGFDSRELTEKVLNNGKRQN